jgi:hypothetical protein
MATQSATSDTTTRSTKQDEGVAQTVRNVADTVAGAAGDVSARVPEVAQSTREAFTEATRLVQRGSDQTLKVVGAASIGFATGLLVGGANRILVIASLIPAALIGATMVERTDGTTTGTRGRTDRV